MPGGSRSCSSSWACRSSVTTTRARCPAEWRQRVALGRLLAYDPEIMLMDEPFGALDAQTKILMGYELLRIWTDHRKSVVFVTHDIEEAIGLSDRILVMTSRPGRIKSEYHVDLPRPRDLRGVRKMPAFHQLSEQIWRDIVAGA